MLSSEGCALTAAMRESACGIGVRAKQQLVIITRLIGKRSRFMTRGFGDDRAEVGVLQYNELHGDRSKRRGAKSNRLLVEIVAVNIFSVGSFQLHEIYGAQPVGDKAKTGDQTA